MPFLEENEEKVITKFMNNYNNDLSPDKQVDIICVKSVVYSFLMENTGETFSSITDTHCRDHINSRIEVKLQTTKEHVINALKETLIDDCVTIMYDSDPVPREELSDESLVGLRPTGLSEDKLICPSDKPVGDPVPTSELESKLENLSFTKNEIEESLIEFFKENPHFNYTNICRNYCGYEDIFRKQFLLKHAPSFVTIDKIENYFGEL